MLEPAAVPPAIEREDRRPFPVLLLLAFDSLGYGISVTPDGAAAEGRRRGVWWRARRSGEGPGRHCLLLPAPGCSCEVAAVQAGWLHNHQGCKGCKDLACAVFAHDKESFKHNAVKKQAYERPVFAVAKRIASVLLTLAVAARVFWQLCYARLQHLGT